MGLALNNAKDHLMLVGLFWGGAVAIFTLGVAAAAWYYSDYSPTKALVAENACYRLENILESKSTIYEAVKKTKDRGATGLARSDLTKAQQKVKIFCGGKA